MKKYLFLFLLPLLFAFPKDVFAQTIELGTPYYYVTENGDASVLQGNASSVGWWGNDNYFWSGHYLGNLSGDPYVYYRQDYNFNNANLCVNNDILISGYVGGLFNFFTDNSYQLDIYNNNEKMACTTEIQESGSRLYYSCSGKGGGTYSITVKTNTFTGIQYQIGVSKNVNVTCNPTSEDIINNQNNNTNNIINNNNHNTQTIIENLDDKFSNKCPNLFNSNTIVPGDITGAFTDIRLSSTQDIYLQPGTYYFSTNLSSPFQYALSVNDVNHPPLGSYPQYIYNSGWKNDKTISFTTTKAGWFVVQFRNSSSNNSLVVSDVNSFNYMLSTDNSSYCVFGSSTNKLDETNDKLDDINDNLTNGDVRDFSIGDFDLGIDLDPENSPVSALLTLPISLLNAFLSGLEGKCFGYDIPFFFDSEITLPCIDMEHYLGEELWHTIDLICCIFLIYNIGLMVVSFYERVTSLHDVFDGLYAPKHQAPDVYVPKHGRD